MTRLYIVLSFMFASLPSYSQYFIEGRVTLNTFDMHDMKALQKELFINFPLEARITDSFNPYVGYQLSFGTTFEKESFSWRTGAIFGYTSTGGRVGYSDYSGIVRGDQLLNLFSFGILGGIEKNTSNQKWAFGVDLPLTYDLTSFTLKSELKVGNQIVDSENYRFKSEGLSIQPRVNLLRNFSTWSVGISAGFHASLLNPDLVWKGDDSSTITLKDSDESLKAHWNGIRVGILFRYKLAVP